MQLRFTEDGSTLCWQSFEILLKKTMKMIVNVGLPSSALLLMLGIFTLSKCACEGANLVHVDPGHRRKHAYMGHECNLKSGVCIRKALSPDVLQFEVVSSEIKALQIPELEQEHVHIKNPQNVAKIIRQMMNDAHHKLQVVADFDRTLSKYAHKGQVCSTTHGVLEDSRHMSDEFKEKATALKQTYLPIEFDGSKTIAEKIPYMIEWWTKGHSLIASSHLTRDLLRTIVRSSTAHLRDGCQWFFDQLHEHEIPLLIFSAGLGDIITELISYQGQLYNNMKVVSNFLQFDEEGKVTGFQNDMVHVFNKNENAIHSSDYFENIKHRENLILLGDSLGDLRMAEGAGDLECMLKIGFLNFKVEENLQQYKDSFDIVIIQDETMDVVNSLMRKILGHS